jgi:hypothetical protein
MIDKHGEPVRENYRNQGRMAERDYLIGLIERQVCFDALADHESQMATFRHAILRLSGVALIMVANAPIYFY